MKTRVSKQVLGLIATLLLGISALAYGRLIVVTQAWVPQPDTNAANVQSTLGIQLLATLRNTIVFAIFRRVGQTVADRCGLYTVTRVTGSDQVEEIITYECGSPSPEVCEANNDGDQQVNGCPPFQPPSTPTGSAYLNYCNGNVATFTNTFGPGSGSGGPALTYEMQWKTSLNGQWFDYYEGLPSCVPFVTTANTWFRVRAVNSAGASSYKTYIANHNCSSGQNSW